MMQDAGRKGVQYEVRGEHMSLTYAPRTQAMIGQKVDGRLQMQTHQIGPPDGVMSRIWVADYTIETDDHEEVYDSLEFGLDRECVPVLDNGGPWIREHRNLEELNEYLSLFGLKVDGVVEGVLDVKIVDAKEPSDLCDHEPDWYLLQVVEVDTILGSGISIEAEVPCENCSTKRTVRFTVPEEAWDEAEKE